MGWQREWESRWPVVEPRLERVQEFFDAQAPIRDAWKTKNAYYHAKVQDYMKFLIPEGYRVLEIGSGDGALLNDLKPSRGVGIEASPKFIELAKGRYPHLEFRHDFAENFKCDDKFDYVVLSNLVGYLNDVQEVFENLHQVCLPSTRIVINYYNYLWEPILTLADHWGLRMKQGVQNWLSLKDLENLLHISGFETIKKVRKILFPLRVPVVSELINRDSRVRRETD